MSASPLRSVTLSKTSTSKTVEIPIPPTPVLGRPGIPYDDPLLATKSFETAPSSPLPSSHQLASEEKETVQEKVQDVDEKNQEKTQEFLKKYDPGDMAYPVLQISDMSLHRRMLRTFYLDNLLWATARLQRHVWFAASQKDVYKDLCTDDRRDRLHDDLQRYTQAVQSWTYWKTSIIQKTDLVTPPNYDTYGRTLAMLECASRHNPDTITASMIKETSTALFKDLADWTRAQSTAHGSREATLKAKNRQRHLMNRMAMSTFGGLTLIVPMLIMVLDPRKLTTVVVTSIFKLGIGLILAVWMTDAESKDMIAATAAYAAVLVVFVGAGSNF